MSDFKLYTPACVYCSLFDYKENFQKDSYINFSKFLPNQNEFVLLSNDKKFRLIKLFNYDNIWTTKELFCITEKNYIYDLDM